MSAKTDLIERIKRRFGWPSVRVEIDSATIGQHIDYAKDKYIKYAIGNATQEVFFTVMLSANQIFYDMPDGTKEVIGYDMRPSTLGGINTLFTIPHMLYEQGLFAILDPMHAGGYNLLSYHIARDFLETLAKYTPDQYNFKFHPFTRKLEIQPPPPSGNFLTIGDYSYDSPGFVLVRAYMVRNATNLDDYSDDFLNSDMYTTQWVEDYAYARSMETLGLVRRKFANFSALGTQGTALDGDNLVNEAKELQEKLMEDLMTKETYEGGYLTVG